MIRKATIAWFLMIPVAILNGGLRNALFEPWVGELRAHQLSVVTGSLAFFGIAFALLHRDVTGTPNRRLLGLGAIWTGATIGFEFGFGHWVMGSSWSRLLSDYNLLEGRLWPVVLLVVMLSPLLVKHLSCRIGEVGDTGHATARHGNRVGHIA